jgi:hypothetical protein
MPTGKEGYPTLAFQVVSSHTKKILGITGPFYRTWNDKTIARLDGNVLKFTEGDLSTKEWSWQDADGNVHREKGLYMICDGGYHLWPSLICPFKDQMDGSDEKKWSSLLESLQKKDVECVFGILKKTFRDTETCISLPYAGMGWVRRVGLSF